MGIGKKIQLITSSLVAAVAFVLLAVVVFQESSLKKTVKAEIHKSAETQMEAVITDVYNMCFALNEMVEDKVQSELKVARLVMKNLGTTTLQHDQMIRWNAVNQFTKNSTPLELPALWVGPTWLGQNSEFGSISPIVDEVHSLVGGTCTIFQRMNDRGDMLRVATNVRKLDGKRAIGTYIPAINPNGEANAVVSTVLKGETFYGRAYVVNAWYITAYEPIYDDANNVVGILYAGVKEEAVESLRESMKETIVGQTGFITAIETAGKFEGQMQINNERISLPDNVFQYSDKNGDSTFQLLRKKLLEEKQNTVTLSFYDEKGEEKLVSGIYFKEWDWILVAITSYSDFTGPIIEIGRALRTMKVVVFIITLFSIIAAIAIMYRFARSITDPLKKVVQAADSVRDGDISVTLTNNREDEIGELIEAFIKMSENIQKKVELTEMIANNDLSADITLASEKDTLGIALQKMSKNLNRVLSGIRSSSNNVANNSSQVSDSSEALSDGAVRSAAAVEEISSSVTEIDGQLKRSSEQAKQANDIALQAKSSVARGTQEMESLQSAMSEIADSSKSISNILKLIDDIAFQTNLLALNAAVEAARAGQHGKGFAVVAEEVRNLAARSATAAKQTDELVAQSNASVENGSIIVARTAEALSEIVEQITETGTLVADIARASEEQSLAISQISEGLHQIDEVTQNNSASAEETAAASMQLMAEARQLQNGIAQFTIKGAAAIELPPTAEPTVHNPTPRSLPLSSDYGEY